MGRRRARAAPFRAQEDTSGERRFEPPSAGAPSSSRVLAVDAGDSIAALFDPDAALRRVSSLDVEFFYRATGGIYSRFMRVSESNFGVLRPSDAAAPLALGNFGVLSASDAAAPLALTLEDDARLGADVACRRRVVFENDALGDRTSPPAIYHVDRSLDAGAVCGLSATDCRSETLADLAPPAIEARSTGRRRRAQCRKNAALEVLLVFQAERVCEACRCRWSRVLDAYVASPEALPSWWPCGTALDPCASPERIDVFDFDCR